MRLLSLRWLLGCLLLCTLLPPVCAVAQSDAATSPSVPQHPGSSPAADLHPSAAQHAPQRAPAVCNNPRASIHATGATPALTLEPDSIVVTTGQPGPCGAVQGTVRFLSRKGTTPVGLRSIALDPAQSSNYTLVPSTTVEGSSAVDVTLTVTDPSLDARAVVVVTDRALQRVVFSHEYTAQRVLASPATVSLGTLAVGTEQCTSVTVANPTASPLELHAVELGGTGAFTLSSVPSLPLTLSAGQSVTVTVCGSAPDEGLFTDSLRARLSCYSSVVADLSMQTALVRVTMNDQSFGQVPVGSEQAREVVIENISNGAVPVQLSSVDWADKEHFRTEGLEDNRFPIVLPEPGDTYTFTVYYTPTEEGVQNNTVALFTGNTTLDKVQSTWSGSGVLPVSVQERTAVPLLQFSVAPQPFAGTGSVHYTLDSPASVELSVYTLLGERVLVADKGPQGAGEHTIYVNSLSLLPGLYLFRIDAGGHSAIRAVFVGE